MSNIISGLPINVFYTIIGIFAFLILATIITFILPVLKPDGNFKELKQRIKSWWVMIIVFSIAIAISRKISFAFMGLVSFLALKEYLTIIPTRMADRRVLLFAYLSIPIQFYWIATGWYGMFIIFIPVYVFLFLPIVMVIIGETEGFLKAVGSIQWGLMTMVFSLSHMSYLLVLPPENNPNGGSVGLLLFLVLLTQSNDIFQYISGKLFGKRKIIPKVSPNKTWEGFLGALAITMLNSYLLSPVLTPFNVYESLLLGALLATMGFFGDLVVSAIKRDLHIKDTGDIIPGHGGVLDRIDSLIYTAPVFLHFTRYFYY
ncbi:MAG: phosphatidate cytidylyltransferase [Leptospirales bacterium]